MCMKMQGLLHTGNEISHPSLTIKQPFSQQRRLTLAYYLTSLLGVTGSRVPTPRCDRLEGGRGQILILPSRGPNPATESARRLPPSHHQDLEALSGESSSRPPLPHLAATIQILLWDKARPPSNPADLGCIQREEALSSFYYPKIPVWTKNSLQTLSLFQENGHGLGVGEISTDW